MRSKRRFESKVHDSSSWRETRSQIREESLIKN